MDTIFGVSVMLQTPFTVEVKVSGDHFDKTEGLCGTCNGDVTDDFYTKTGVVVSSLCESTPSKHLVCPF